MASAPSAGRITCTRSQLHGRVWHWQTSAATCWMPLGCVAFAALAVGGWREPETGRFQAKGCGRRGYDRLRNAGRTPERCWRLELAGRQSSLDWCIAGRPLRGERKVLVMTNRPPGTTLASCRPPSGNRPPPPETMSRRCPCQSPDQHPPPPKSLAVGMISGRLLIKRRNYDETGIKTRSERGNLAK